MPSAEIHMSSARTTYKIISSMQTEAKCLLHGLAALTSSRGLVARSLRRSFKFGRSDRAGTHFLSYPDRTNSCFDTERMSAIWYRT